ncbi:hypothetical protein COO60DRAFT_408644 [Scenedesmus sp. NREL 46B-D3]|nr:hypothetical protein COO60DRAFT_408644 [Scenedesmus sp. NREL 46B-D3]
MPAPSASLQRLQRAGCLQDVCKLLQQGFNAAVIIVGHSTNTLASSRHILCSVTEQLNKPAQADAGRCIAVACSLAFSSGTIDLFDGRNSAELSARAALSTSPSKRQHIAAGPSTAVRVQSAAQVRKALKLGSNSANTGSASSSCWLIGGVDTSHHCGPCETDHLEAVVSQLWCSTNTTATSSSGAVPQHSSSCLSIVDLSSCYRAAERASSWPGEQRATSNSTNCSGSSSPSRRSPGAQRHQGASLSIPRRGHYLLQLVAQLITGPTCCHWLVQEAAAAAASAGAPGQLITLELLAERCARQQLQRVLQDAVTIKTVCEPAVPGQGPWQQATPCRMLSFQEFVDSRKTRPASAGQQLQGSRSAHSATASHPLLAALDQLKLQRSSTSKSLQGVAGDASSAAAPGAGTAVWLAQGEDAGRSSSIITSPVTLGAAAAAAAAAAVGLSSNTAQRLSSCSQISKTSTKEAAYYITTINGSDPRDHCERASAKVLAGPVVGTGLCTGAAAVSMLSNRLVQPLSVADALGSPRGSRASAAAPLATTTAASAAAFTARRYAGAAGHVLSGEAGASAACHLLEQQVMSAHLQRQRSSIVKAATSPAFTSCTASAAPQQVSLQRSITSAGQREGGNSGAPIPAAVQAQHRPSTLQRSYTSSQRNLTSRQAAGVHWPLYSQPSLRQPGLEPQLALHRHHVRSPGCNTQ